MAWHHYDPALAEYVPPKGRFNRAGWNGWALQVARERRESLKTPVSGWISRSAMEPPRLAADSVETGRAMVIDGLSQSV